MFEDNENLNILHKIIRKDVKEIMLLIVNLCIKADNAHWNKDILLDATEKTWQSMKMMGQYELKDYMNSFEFKDDN